MPKKSQINEYSDTVSNHLIATHEAVTLTFERGLIVSWTNEEFIIGRMLKFYWKSH